MAMRIDDVIVGEEYAAEWDRPQRAGEVLPMTRVCKVRVVEVGRVTETDTRRRALVEFCSDSPRTSGIWRRIDSRHRWHSASLIWIGAHVLIGPWEEYAGHLNARETRERAEREERERIKQTLEPAAAQARHTLDAWVQVTTADGADGTRDGHLHLHHGRTKKMLRAIDEMPWPADTLEFHADDVPQNDIVDLLRALGHEHPMPVYSTSIDISGTADDITRALDTAALTLDLAITGWYEKADTLTDSVYICRGDRPDTATIVVRDLATLRTLTRLNPDLIGDAVLSFHQSTLGLADESVDVSDALFA